MLKKIMFSMGFLGSLFTGCSPVHAAAPVQDVGPVKISTMVAISVTTTPVVLLSTGFNMNLESIAGSRAVDGSTYTINGQFLPGRVSLEILNYSTNPLWIGYDANVTSFPSVNMGRRIERSTGTTSGIDTPGRYFTLGSIWNYWIKSNDNIPTRSVLIIQDK